MMEGSKRVHWEVGAFMIGAFILSYVPILHIPFSWITTFFHEVSHGLMAICTGGTVTKIHLHLNGSGLCTTQGGNSFLVAFAGYSGAVLWGMVIYSMVDWMNHRYANLIAMLLALCMGMVALLWGGDVLTWIILVVLMVFFISIVKLRETRFIKCALKLIGMFVLLDAIKSPLHLIDGRHYGDGARLADITALPELLWVILWFIFGVFGAFLLWNAHKVK